MARGQDGAGRGGRDGGPRRRAAEEGAPGGGGRRSREPCVHSANGASSFWRSLVRCSRLSTAQGTSWGGGHMPAARAKRLRGRRRRATDSRVRCLLMFTARGSGGNVEAGRDAAAREVCACVLGGAGASDRYSAAMASCSCELASGINPDHRRSRRSAPACSRAESSGFTTGACGRHRAPTATRTAGAALYTTAAFRRIGNSYSNIASVYIQQ